MSVNISAEANGFVIERGMGAKYVAFTKQEALKYAALLLEEEIEKGPHNLGSRYQPQLIDDGDGPITREELDQIDGYDESKVND